jgi:hypothetical protein
LRQKKIPARAKSATATIGTTTAIAIFALLLNPSLELSPVLSGAPAVVVVEESVAPPGWPDVVGVKYEVRICVSVLVSPPGGVVVGAGGVDELLGGLGTGVFGVLLLVGGGGGGELLVGGDDVVGGGGGGEEDEGAVVVGGGGGAVDVGGGSLVVGGGGGDDVSTPPAPVLVVLDMMNLWRFSRG